MDQGTEVLSIEQRYAALKELQLDNIPEQCAIALPKTSFDRAGTAETFGMRTIYPYMALAVREPDWLPLSTDLPDNKNPLLLPTDKLIEYCGSVDESMLPFAHDYNGLRQPFNYGQLAARAFELMSDDFPDLSLFRGTDFKRPLNSDFTLSIPGALTFVYTIGGTGGKRREFPSFVRLPIKNLIAEYREQMKGISRLSFGSGSSYAIGSVRVGGDYGSMKYDISRPPSSLKTEQEQDAWIAQMTGAARNHRSKITAEMLHEAVQKRLVQYM